MKIAMTVSLSPNSLSHGDFLRSPLAGERGSVSLREGA